MRRNIWLALFVACFLNRGALARSVSSFIYLGAPYSELEPCGCEFGPAGGLPRLYEAVRKFKPNFLVIKGPFIPVAVEESVDSIQIIAHYKKKISFFFEVLNKLTKVPLFIGLTEKDKAFDLALFESLKKKYPFQFIYENDLSSVREFNGFSIAFGDSEPYLQSFKEKKNPLLLMSSLPGYRKREISKGLRSHIILGDAESDISYRTFAFWKQALVVSPEVSTKSFARVSLKCEKPLSKMDSPGFFLPGFQIAFGLEKDRIISQVKSERLQELEGLMAKSSSDCEVDLEEVYLDKNFEKNNFIQEEIKKYKKSLSASFKK